MGKRWIASLWLAAGCPSKDDDGSTLETDTETGTLVPTGETGTEPVSGDLVVLPEHNYTLDVSWSVQSAPARARWDLLLTWDDLATDAWGEPIDAANVDQIVLIEVLYPPEEVGEHLAADDFGPNLLSTWTLDPEGDVFADISSLSSGPTAFNPQGFLVEEPGKTWLFGAARQDGERLDLRALIGMEIVENSTSVSVDLIDTSSQVTWSASAATSHVQAASGAELYTLDWEAVVTDALGKPFDDILGDELFIGRFDGGVDLSTQLLSLSSAASGWWTMDVERETDARLDLARDSSGGTFPGLDEGPVWLVGVRCTTCLSPFPLWIATIDVAAP